ncbi:MAG: reverse transcriptase domain-containing protein [Bacteroidota bacterium]
MKLEERLNTLNRLNKNSKFVNKQLYRILYSIDLYKIAFERLKTNQGAMTHGISPKSNVDGMSLKKIDKIIKELKDESYQPQPSRRVYITKTNGKKRPLGIPCWRDKLVQEGIKIILTCIYDGNEQPTFTEQSFGFRPNKGCHDALEYVQWEFSGSYWVIKADVKGFFDNVDHSILVKLLEKRIDDKRFIRLIWKFLRCGYMEDGILFKPKKGTPQGGNLSPILSNIYLHEFDMYIKYLVKVKGTIMIPNKAYRKVYDKLRRYRVAVEKSDKRTDDLYAYKKARFDSYKETRELHPSTILSDPNKAVIKYARYADDWVIGLKCNKQVAENIFQKCHDFFRDYLNLEWNLSKSFLKRSTDNNIEFLGVYMTFVNERQVMKRTKRTKDGRKYLRTVVKKHTLRFKMKSSDVFKRLEGKGFVDKNHRPISNKRLINLDVHEIAKIYKTTMNGIGNYYCFVHNPAVLNKIHYWLFLSLGKTLAHKFKSTKAKQIKRFGGRVMIFKSKGKARPIEIPDYGGHLRNINSFKKSVVKDDTIPIMKFMSMKQSTWLNLDECCICDAKGKIEMHHVKHIRKLGKEVKGFTRFMRELNRKQIPVCKECHQKIHKGTYDGLPLKYFTKKLMAKLGIRKWEERNRPPEELELRK